MLPEDEKQKTLKESGDVAATNLIEISLISRNIKTEIDVFLSNHSVFIDGKTRLFLANLRDVMDALARRTKQNASSCSKPISFSRSPARFEIE